MDAKLNQRLGRMSTEELVNIVSVDAHSYTPDARRMAGEILADRGVDVSALPPPSIMAQRSNEKSLFSGMDDPGYGGDESAKKGVSNVASIIIWTTIILFVILLLISDADKRAFTGEGYFW